VVGEAFITNPENKPSINHKDKDKTNNTVSNLEWVTCRENTLHSYNTEKLQSSTIEFESVTMKGEGTPIAGYPDYRIYP